MSVADPRGGVERSSPPSLSAAAAAAPWPGVAFPRRRATPIPVGGAAAVIMSPTPPRYMRPPPTHLPGAPAASTETLPAKTPSRISAKGKLRLLSSSCTMIGDGLAKIYEKAMPIGLSRKALLIGLSAADFCNRVGYPAIPSFIESHVLHWTDWSQLPEFFKGLSVVLEGTNEVLHGSYEAFGAVRCSSRVFHAVRTYIPSAACLQRSQKSHAAYAYGSGPQQGIHTILSYHMIRRSYVDSVLIVDDNNGSRRSPKKVLPEVQTIRNVAELEEAVQKFKDGIPVHLIDVSEHDVSLNMALDFWKRLLAEGATALLKRDSNLCRMSKMAYSLIKEKEDLDYQLITLKNKCDDIEQSIILISDVLESTKLKPRRCIDFSDVGGASTSMTSLAASEAATDQLAYQANEFNTPTANSNISDGI